jgi:hypothetical protein
MPARAFDAHAKRRTPDGHPAAIPAIGERLLGGPGAMAVLAFQTRTWIEVNRANQQLASVGTVNVIGN